MDGYYGNPLDGEPCHPCMCPGAPTSNRYFARSCYQDSQSAQLVCNCLEGYSGMKQNKDSFWYYLINVRKKWSSSTCHVFRNVNEVMLIKQLKRVSTQVYWNYVAELWLGRMGIVQLVFSKGIHLCGYSEVIYCSDVTLWKSPPFQMHYTNLVGKGGESCSCLLPLKKKHCKPKWEWLGHQKELIRFPNQRKSFSI